MRVRYDPSVIPYTQLLELFWSHHDPFSGAFSRQYRAVLFYHDEEQRRLGEDSLRGMEAGRGKAVMTAIEPAGPFYSAEEYHQKYYLQGDRGIFDEMRAIYPHFEDLVASTAAARVNGFLGGWGSDEEVRRVLPLLGLSDGACGKILKRAGRSR